MVDFIEYERARRMQDFNAKNDLLIIAVIVFIFFLLLRLL